MKMKERDEEDKEKEIIMRTEAKVKKYTSRKVIIKTQKKEAK